MTERMEQCTCASHPAAGDAAPLAVRAKDAARLLGIGERQVWSLTSAGKIPHVRIGRIVLFPIRDLQEWLSRRARSACRSHRSAPDKAPDSP